MKEPGIGGSTVDDGGAYCDGVAALYPRVVTAGGGLDNVYQDGEDLDRLAMKLPQSCKYVIPYRIVMASGGNCVISTAVQHKDTGETYADYPKADGSAAPADVTINANNDGSAIVGRVAIDVDLAGAKQYVRCRSRFNLSASGTDTAAIAAVAVLFGLESRPA